MFPALRLTKGCDPLLKLFALILFLVMYVLMLALPRRRPWVTSAAALLTLATGLLPLRALPAAINWNVLFMLTGAMIVVHYFIRSGMPVRIADLLMARSKNVMMVTVSMSLFSGAISAFIDNVATVLMVVPVGLAVCRSLKIDPVPMVLSIAVSSNLQGAATLVGDTTSVMLGDYAHMDFLSFFWMQGKPGIFFAVELGALSTVAVMLILFRKERQPVSAAGNGRVEDTFPAVMLLVMVGSLIAASFLPEKPEVTNGLICLASAAVVLLRDLIRSGNARGAAEAVVGVDAGILILLAGLFVVIAGVSNAGLIADFSQWIVRVGGGSLFLLFTIVLFGSVLFSAFVDNIPYVAAMLPVLESVTASMGIEPYLLYFALLSGATLGGNLTPFGASANLTAVSLLAREGHVVSYKTFARIGVPFTLAAVCTAYVFLWLVWG